METLRATVAAVHAVGGRLAVHSQQSDGGAAAVAARVDSLEHGMCLDADLLQQMAHQSTALTPTLSAISDSLAKVKLSQDSPRKRWYVAGAEAHPALTIAAHEAGVTLLAGTDSRPHGRVGDEIRAFVRAGVPPQAALAAASWAARAYLGHGGLQPGAEADAVVYATDPRLDLQQLDVPLAVILRGRVVARG